MGSEDCALSHYISDRIKRTFCRWGHMDAVGSSTYGDGGIGQPRCSDVAEAFQCN